MQSLNWVDYTIIVIFLLSILSGFWRGLVKEVISLITLVAAFVFATLFSHPLATVFTHNPSVQGVMNQAAATAGVSAAQPVSYLMIAICFTIIFIGVIVLGAIISSLVSLALHAGILGIGNRILGAAFGVIRGFIINLVLIFVVQLTSMADEPYWQHSQLVADFQPAVQWLDKAVSPSLANLKQKFVSPNQTTPPSQ